MRILLVQWDVAAAQRRAIELESHGWKVDVESSDAARALRRAKELGPDVVVVDLSSATRQGIDAARSIREGKATRAAQVVLVDAADPEGAVRKVAGAAVTTSGGLVEALGALATPGSGG